MDLTASHTAQARRSLSRGDLLLFLLFCAYGPSFSFAGQLRYVEALLVVWALLRFSGVFLSLKGTALNLTMLFGLAGLIHLASGIFHGSPTTAIVARSGTYLLLAALIPILIALVRDDMRRLLFILTGYCASYVVLLFVGSSTSAHYAEVPWRLGLGFAATVALAALFAVRPRYLPLAPTAFLGLALFHIVMESRSMAAMSICAGLFVLLSNRIAADRPRQARFGEVVVAICGLLVFGWIGLQVLLALAEAGWLPERVAAKLLAQASHSAGIVAAARPDTVTALFAITQRPLFGYGPGVVAPEVFAVYVRLSSEALFSGALSSELMQDRMNMDWSLGTPSHSHLFGAWADAGVLAALCWIAVLGLAAVVLVRGFGLRDRFVPLFSLIAIATVWDVLFSPGPHRMDIALRIVVLLAALDHFRGREAESVSRRARR